MEQHPIVVESSRSYYTAPWRKARICARFILRPELLVRERYARIARILVQDETASNRLIDQAVAHLKGRLYQRHRST